MVVIHTGNLVNWPKGSQKYDLFINEECVVELFDLRQ